MLLNHLHYAGLTNHCISSLFFWFFFPQGAADLLIDMFFFLLRLCTVETNRQQQVTSPSLHQVGAPGLVVVQVLLELVVDRSGIVLMKK